MVIAMSKIIRWKPRAFLEFDETEDLVYKCKYKIGCRHWNFIIISNLCSNKGNKENVNNVFSDKHKKLKSFLQRDFIKKMLKKIKLIIKNNNYRRLNLRQCLF
jgi:hypothetical protein